MPRRAQAYGEFIRRVAVLVRAGLPVPAGYAVARDVADQFYADVLSEPERAAALLNPAHPLPGESELEARKARVRSAGLREGLSQRLRELFDTLRSLGAQTLTDISLSIFVGTIVAAYSTIFVAAPLYSLLRENEPGMKTRDERVLAARELAGQPV